MSENVVCHSGYTYAEKPVAINWEGRRLEILSLLASWRTPMGRHFKVRTANDMEFELTFHETPGAVGADSIDEMWQIQQL
jgi:hypothetical protein